MSEGGNGDPEAASGEFAAIERIRRLLPPPPDGDVWVGDDAAVVSMPGGERLLFAADCVVEGVHFDLDLVRPADVGWKALAVNVSDIAAMGGRPLQAVVTVVGAGGDLLDELMGGLAEAAVAFGCDVVGGDLSSGSCIVVSVAITGTPGDRGAVLRSRARAGDLIYVTGPLGRSAAGLRALQAGQRTGRGDETVDGLIAAHRRPVARVAEGLAAAAAGATAMIDISDGLGIDLDHLATASAIGVALEAVPVADGATLDDALAGGEDYELVFAARDPVLVERTFEAGGLRRPIRMGVCVPDPTVRRVGADPLPVRGWEHRLRRA